LGKALTAVGIPNESLARSDLGRLEGTFVGSETVVSPGDDIFAVGPLKRVSGRLVLTSSLIHRTPTFLTNLSRAAYLQRLGGQARKFLVGLVVNSLVIALVVSIVRHYGFVAPW
jgi:hypothetical protein